MSEVVEAVEPSAAPAVETEQPSQEAQAPETESQAPEVEANEPEQVPSGEENTVKTEPEQKKNSFQDRISQLNRRAKEAEQRAADAERRAQVAEQQLTGDGEETPFPKLEDFEYDEQKWQQAVMEHNAQVTQKAAKQARLDEQRMEAEEAHRERLQYAAETFQERSRAYAEENPEYHARVQNPAFHQSRPVQEAILFSENGPALADYLASNLHETNEINNLSPVMAGMRLATIANKLATPPPVIPPKTPDPISPVTPSGSVEKDPSDMTPTEYREWRQKGKK